ncbi:MAG: BREX-6 system BrxE protein [Xenococcaceae cyanobacterium MO_167.B27]|nr:BREX-6 system BrxE protein [Xenococcaceae cyanobacterium MO_167.B27]
MSFIQTEIETEQLKNKIAPEELDVVLMLQFFVSWAGERLTDPSRLGWWSTQLLDEWGGEDLFKRLFPITFEWALLEAVRKVAIQADKQKRINLAQPDNVCTLFFWGFGIDEKLEERLSFHKQNASNPYDILNFPLDLKEDFEEKVFEQAIQKFNPEVKYKIVPEGREIKGVIPELIADAAKNLVSGLIPLADRYPMPFYRIQEKAG